MSNFDILLEKTGGFGRYQVLVYIWFTSTIFMLAPAVGFMIFGGIPPSECEANGQYHTNGTTDSLITLRGMNGSRCNNCTNDFQSVVIFFQLTGNRKGIAATVTALQMLGTTLGPLMAGWFCDRYGRKISFLVTISGLETTLILAAFSTTWQTFATLGFFIGFFAGGTQTCALSLSCESLPSKHRSLITFPGWTIGFIWLSVLALYADTWQNLLVFIASVYPVILLLSLLVLESPKWLMERNRHCDSKRNLSRIARINRCDLENLNSFYIKNIQLVNNNIDVENMKVVNNQKEEQFSKPLIQEQPPPTTYTFIDLYRNWKMTGQSLTISACWFTTGCVSYLLTFDMVSLTGKLWLNVIIVNVIRMLFQAIIPVLDKYIHYFGRRAMIQMGLISMGIGLGLKSLAASNVCPEGQSDVIYSVGSFVGLTMSSFAWAGCTLFGAELFPTGIRTMGISICNVGARLGATFSPYILLLATKWLALPYILTFFLVILSSVLAYVILPETKNKPLSDMPLVS